MSLRTKLLLAQAPMALILVIISAFSVWMVSFLGSHSQTILKDNYRSVLAAQRMKEAIERMDSAALFLIAGRRDKGLSQAAQYRPLFESELQVQENNITEPGEREVTQRFLAAAMGGDLDELMMVLAPDVTLITDGGGKVKAALRPITGAAKVARGLTAAAGGRYMEIGASGLTIEAAEINGGPGMLVTAGGEPTVAVVTVVADGRITAIYVVANPDKLRGLTAGHNLSL